MDYRFITFEGGEGSGKSLCVNRFVKYLSDLGHDVLQTRDPGGTEISMEIRKILLAQKNALMCVETELLLYEAARAQLVNEKIIPALQAGKIVVSDRFHNSTLVYQGVGRGWKREILDWFEDFVLTSTYPCITFILDVVPEVGLARSLKKNDERLNEGGQDEARFENEELLFHYRIREAYLGLVSENPDNYLVIDTTEKTPDEVFDEVIHKFNKKVETWPLAYHIHKPRGEKHE